MLSLGDFKRPGMYSALAAALAGTDPAACPLVGTAGNTGAWGTPQRTIALGVERIHRYLM